ncbi:T-cell surface glycoprotein CD1b-like isoform X2 [Microcebus murinus]|uniref:T-cell surface glycoprotein CD1b-like isoform X2 n=1 Tax=Microcebus murinus TaxID=30608 RepID=UPI003F6D529E
MLLLPFQLLAVLFPGGDSEDALQGPTSFHVIQISSFANSTWARNQGSGWLDDLQIHGWDSDSGTAIFLKPWSKGNISDEEIAEVVEIFRVYFFGFTQEVEGRASEFQLELKPEAWLSSGPSPGPGRLLLVCHVSGFYPKPVWVRWMRGEQEQPGTQHSDLLPNADWTWYLRATLDVAAGEAAGLSCRVKHSSLEGQDIILHWGHPISIGLIFLAIIVPSLIVLLCLSLWYIRRRSYQDIP